MELVLRKTERKDIEGVIELLNKYSPPPNGYPQSREAWIYQMLRNPNGPAISYVIEDRDSNLILGHHCYIPLPGCIFGRKVLCHKSEATVVDETIRRIRIPISSRDRGALSSMSLLWKVNADAAKTDADFRFGLGGSKLWRFVGFEDLPVTFISVFVPTRPNIDSRAFGQLIKKVSFKFRIPYNLMAILMPGANLLEFLCFHIASSNHGITVEHISSFDTRLERFWLDFLRKIEPNISLDRDLATMNFRFAASRYVKFYLHYDGNLIGYFIGLKSKNTLKLIDFLVSPQYLKLVPSILKSIVTQPSVGSIKMLHLEHFLSNSYTKAFYQQLKRCYLLQRFFEHKSRMLLGSNKPLDLEEEQSFYSPDNWLITPIFFQYF